LEINQLLVQEKKNKITCGVAFRSIGYKSVPIAGLSFDDKIGIVPNNQGRVLSKDTLESGLYVAGWLKRGPSGIIGTNKYDSIETVQMLSEDLENGILRDIQLMGFEGIKQILLQKKLVWVSFSDWKKLEHYENTVGSSTGKPREKVSSVTRMLEIINSTK